jgi:hypothetical protein
MKSLVPQESFVGGRGSNQKRKNFLFSTQLSILGRIGTTKKPWHPGDKSYSMSILTWDPMEMVSFTFARIIIKQCLKLEAHSTIPHLS